jgi:pimeloyl-ACP methyl ester carboxylesterase
MKANITMKIKWTLLWAVCMNWNFMDIRAQETIHKDPLKDAEVIAASTPAPLYRDPVYDGAADPVLVWNPGKRVWWMFYTQRRAKIDLPGVEWCHGTEIGVAESGDSGFSWTYLGTLPLSHPDDEYSFWAPDVILDDGGNYHLFPSYVPGPPETHRHWGGERHIFHYTSKDLWNWKFQERVPLSSDYCIDATLFKKQDGKWRMWYKDEAHGSKTLAVESSDLRTWNPVEDPGVSELYGEGPKTFRFKGHYWLIKDPNSGLDVYRSADLESWVYQGKILDQPGTRNSDGTIGKHADIVISGDRAYIIYFTHPYSENAPERNGVSPLSNRHTALQVAELEVIDGRLVCDRDKPFRMILRPRQDNIFTEYEIEEFTFKGHEAKVVFPNEKGNGHWIWRARFWGHEPQVDKALLGKGFHVVYIDVADLFGNQEAVDLWNNFYIFCIDRYKFNPKVVLEGMSRGGLIIYNWASQNTEKVACIYADAPVCDIKSWPGGLYRGKGSPEAWIKCLEAYHLNEQSVIDFKGIPIYTCINVAKAKIPVLHVFGDADKIVPYEENTGLLTKNFEAAGGEIQLIKKRGIGHHPHSLENPEPIVDFILNNTPDN